MSFQHSQHTDARCLKCRADLFTLRLLSAKVEVPEQVSVIRVSRVQRPALCARVSARPSARPA
jgi:hypothetical protein